jgi:hypothetical protein
MVNDHPQTHIVENQSEIIPNYPSQFTYVQATKLCKTTDNEHKKVNRRN